MLLHVSVVNNKIFPQKTRYFPKNNKMIGNYVQSPSVRKKMLYFYEIIEFYEIPTAIATSSSPQIEEDEVEAARRVGHLG